MESMGKNESKISEKKQSEASEVNGESALFSLRDFRADESAFT